ncbi:hypothetical protein [Mesorhizobium sp. NPDC059025]|uniref:hypothetical protein n=1 Tax=unclassified Mesorhizobium TaxID=325217 RepID=UPI0036A0F1E0
MNKWWPAVLAVVTFAFLAIANGSLGEIGGVINNWTLSQISPPKELLIEFNDVLGCSSGKLADIAKRQMNNVELTNGADSLVICDNQPLRAIRSELPRSLANRVPGCLEWRGWQTGGLGLVRKSSSVCSLPGGKRYICDGPNARHALGKNAVGDSLDPIQLCPDRLLEQFGFATQSVRDR